MDHLPIEPALFAIGKTAYGEGIGEQHWSASLRAADSFIMIGVGFNPLVMVPEIPQATCRVYWKMCVIY